MFSIDNFIEIQVVGFLMLLAISPIINLLTKELRTQEGFCPFFENIPDKSAKAILLLVLAFAVGIAGNRLVDETFDSLNIEGREEFECKSNGWLAMPFSTKRLGDCPEESVSNLGEYIKINPDKLKTIKLAEYFISDHSPMADEYFERHKSFMRVLRGAAFASLFLLFSMLIYQAVRRKSKLPSNDRPCDRYNYAHFMIVFVFFLIFTFAYKFEAHHYYNRVVNIYTGNFFDQKKPAATEK